MAPPPARRWRGFPSKVCAAGDIRAEAVANAGRRRLHAACVSPVTARNSRGLSGKVVEVSRRSLYTMPNNGPAGAFKQKDTVSLWKNTFAAPSTYFLLYRTGFLVILQYSKNQAYNIGSLLYGDTTSCRRMRYA